MLLFGVIALETIYTMQTTRPYSKKVTHPLTRPLASSFLSLHICENGVPGYDWMMMSGKGVLEVYELV